MARLLILFLSLVAFGQPLNVTADDGNDSDQPFHYHEIIGAIYRHHDDSIVLYAIEPDHPNPQRNGLRILVDRVTRYVPYLKNGLAGHPKSTGKLLLFTHSRHKLFLVGDSWLSDKEHTLMIDKKDFFAITDIKRKGATPRGALNWKKRWQQEMTDLLERKKWLDEWEKERAGATTDDKPINFSRESDEHFIESKASTSEQNPAMLPEQKSIKESSGTATSGVHPSKIIAEKSTTTVPKEKLELSGLHKNWTKQNPAVEDQTTQSLLTPKFATGEQKNNHKHIIGLVILLGCCFIGFKLFRKA